MNCTVKFLLTAEAAEMTFLLGGENTNKKGGGEIRFLNSFSKHCLQHTLMKEKALHHSEVQSDGELLPE